MQNFGGWRTKALTSGKTSTTSKLLEECNQIIWEFIPSSTPGLLSLTSGGKKNKRTELDDRRLTLCHAKLGGRALVSPLAKLLGGRVPSVHPRFVITDFR